MVVSFFLLIFVVMENKMELLLLSEGKTMLIGDRFGYAIANVTIISPSLSSIYDSILEKELKHGEISLRENDNYQRLTFAFGQNNVVTGNYNTAIPLGFNNNNALVTREWMVGSDGDD